MLTFLVPSKVQEIREETNELTFFSERQNRTGKMCQNCGLITRRYFQEIKPEHPVAIKNFRKLIKTRINQQLNTLNFTLQFRVPFFCINENNSVTSSLYFSQYHNDSSTENTERAGRNRSGIPSGAGENKNICKRGIQTHQ